MLGSKLVSLLIVSLLLMGITSAGVFAEDITLPEPAAFDLPETRNVDVALDKDVYELDRASTIISMCTASTTNSGKSITGSAVINCKKSAYRVCVSSVSIQENAGSGWSTVATKSGSVQSNALSASATVSYAGKTGCSYRVIATCYAQETSSTTAEYRYPTGNTVTP